MFGDWGAKVSVARTSCIRGLESESQAHLIKGGGETDRQKEREEWEREGEERKVKRKTKKKRFR